MTKAAGQNPAMIATVIEKRVKERLASCPVCKSDVLADAYAVCCRGEWYHLRCAIEQDAREAEAALGRVAE